MRLVFILLMILRFSLQAHAEGPRVLEFKNVPVKIQSDLKLKFPQAFSKEASYADYDQLIRALMATQLYEDVLVESERSTGAEKITIDAHPIRIVQGVQIKGNDKLSTSEIKSILGIESGDLFLRKKLVDGAERLKQRYGEMGYLNSSIEITFKPGRANSIIVLGNITEGPPCLISSITFDTPNAPLRELLAKKISSIRNRPLTAERISRIREIVEEYFSNNRYLNAQISQPQLEYNEEKTHAHVSFKIENPYRYELIFEGNQQVTAPSLLRALDLSNFPRTTLNPAFDLNNRVAEIYRDRGYAQAQVEVKEKVIDSTFTREIYFKITENKRIKIGSIEVNGRLSRSSDYYAKFIRQNSTDLIASGYYNRSGFDLGMRNLQTELQNQGYLRSKVISFRANYNEDRSRVNVVINLDEGPLTQITDITFHGNKIFKNPNLLSQLNIKSGSSLHLNDIESSIQALKDFYYSQGYIEMKILNETQDLVQYNEDNTRAKINFEIYEGPQVKVASIALDGNHITKNYVIMRELDFQVGDILTPQKISDSITRLQRLGLFGQVTISTVEQGTNIADRTVIVSVSEANPGTFNTGIGVNNEANLTYRTFLGLGYRNLGGTARAITSRIDLSYASDRNIDFLENRFNLGYLEPFVFGTRTSGRISLTRSQQVVAFDPAASTVTIAQSTNGRILLERDLTLHTHLTWTAYGYEVSRIFEKNSRFGESQTFIGTIGPTLDIDYRDNPFNPTKGSYAHWFTEYSAPWLASSGTVEYISTDAQYSHYTRLGSPRFIWANQVRGGYIKNLSDLPNSGVPYTKVMFLGGRSTIRGFNPATERFPDPYELSRKFGQPVDFASWVLDTESTFYLVKTEIRFPIYGIVGGSLFYDGGGVQMTDYIFNHYYRDAVGIGIRFTTPVGPFNFEVGYKLNKESRADYAEESPWAFHFSVGTF